MTIGSRPANGSSSTSRSGLVHERRRELHPLLVALRELLHPASGAVAETEPLEPRAVAAARASRVRQPVQHAEVLELVARPHLRVEAALLRHVADPRRSARRSARPCQVDGPGVRREQPADDPHRRRLARPVAPDKAE